MAGKEEYVSGEQYQAMQQAGSAKRPPKRKVITLPAGTIALVAIVVALCALSFWGGTSYQKHHTKATVASAASSGSSSSGLGGGSGFGGGARRSGGLGQVTAVSGSSITISNQRTNASTTYTITSSTTITDSGQTVTASDIQTGDTVLVMTSSTGSTTATSILVNPSFGGGQGGASNSGSSQTN